MHYILFFLLGLTLIVTGLVAIALTLPKWVFSISLLASFLLISDLQRIIGKIVDPIYTRAVRAHLERLGATDIVVKAHKHHTGVHFTHEGRKLYARCDEIWRGKFKWKGPSPEELIASNKN